MFIYRLYIKYIFPCIICIQFPGKESHWHPLTRQVGSGGPHGIRSTLIHSFQSNFWCSFYLHFQTTTISQAKGLDKSLVHGLSGEEIFPYNIRKCGRCIMNNDNIAAMWFEHVMHVLEGTQCKTGAFKKDYGWGILRHFLVV